MLRFLRDELQLYLLMLSWVVVAHMASPLVYLLLPISLLLLRYREMFPEILFGFFMVLVLSDVHKYQTGFAVFKSAKNIYIVIVAFLFFFESRRFLPFSQVFYIFMPFVLYSLFPLVFSPNITVAVQKTLSYSLLLLVVPNFVLYSYRLHGWAFFRNLVYFLVSVLLMGFYFMYTGQGYQVGRFRGIFGNPNGLGTFSFLLIMLVSVIHSLNRRTFKRWELIAIYLVVLWFLVASGSRASMVALLIFFVFGRFFSSSVFLGFVAFLLFLAGFEMLYANLAPIVTALGLEEYFRLHTLETGSGRYFAWGFAWEKIQEYLVFGGGFGTDEYVMRKNYAYLMAMNHEGGVHNSYLSLWFDVGLVGLLIYLRSFFLLFTKATKRVPMSLGVMFAVLFSVTYESWLVASLNPFTIFLWCIVTVLSEEEIVAPAASPVQEAEQRSGLAGVPAPGTGGGAIAG